MATTLRRRALTAGLVVVALGLIAVGASWLLVRVWGPSLTASQIAAAITEATERPAHVDQVTLEPLRGRVRIAGLTVSGEGEPMARVEHIDVGIRIESLWRLELVIGVVAEGADVRLRRDPNAPPPSPFEMPEQFQLGPSPRVSPRSGSSGVACASTIPRRAWPSRSTGSRPTRDPNAAAWR